MVTHMLGNNLVVMLGQLRAAFGGFHDSSDGSTSRSVEEPYFENMIPGVDDDNTTSNVGYAFYDSFISRLYLFTDSPTRDSNQLSTILTRICGSSKNKNSNIDDTDVEATFVSVLSDLHSNLVFSSNSTRMSNRRRGSNDKGEKLERFIFNQDYDILKNLFYEADAYNGMMNSDKKQVAIRFVQYFLRRYDVFISNEILHMKNPSLPEEEYNYLTLIPGDDVKYYSGEFTIFKRIVRSPIYEKYTTAFIETLLEQLKEAMTSEGEVKIGFDTQSLYYVVLKSFLEESKEVMTTSGDNVDGFVSNMSKMFFGNMYIPYTEQTASNKTLLVGVSGLIDPANVDTDLKKYME
ncbi:hypothetical protein ECANGB1_151 [Enterospora canceri]|uniref:Uncharacterized protein n=1 Tax=Enterospora canceri TaxID=1081671 RepID=A0A1Y1S8F2_9MICR|nr:hypothetical protein ECANGB1_151 [Enterospora canceri]